MCRRKPQSGEKNVSFKVELRLQVPSLASSKISLSDVAAPSNGQIRMSGVQNLFGCGAAESTACSRMQVVPRILVSHLHDHLRIDLTVVVLEHTACSVMI
jgi:hypothetical protein